jgi:hypothetical protein
LSPNEPSNSEIKISPCRSFTSTFRISPEISDTLSFKFSSIIIFLNVMIALGFLSNAITFTLLLTPALLAAASALLISGPRPAPKYNIVISSLVCESIYMESSLASFGAL